MQSMPSGLAIHLEARRSRSSWSSERLLQSMRAALLEARLAELRAELARKDAAIAALSRHVRPVASPGTMAAASGMNVKGNYSREKRDADAPEVRITTLHVTQPDLVDSPAGALFKI